jgi:hypothetical protein
MLALRRADLGAKHAAGLRRVAEEEGSSGPPTAIRIGFVQGGAAASKMVIAGGS